MSNSSIYRTKIKRTDGCKNLLVVFQKLRIQVNVTTVYGCYERKIDSQDHSYTGQHERMGE